MVSVWLSPSVALTPHDSVLSLCAVLGVMVTELMVGAMFSMDTDTDSVVVAPYPSVTSATHVILSAGCANVFVKVMVSPVPMMLEPFFHVYVGMRVSLSRSVTVTAQANDVEVYTDVEGEIDRLLKVGAVFPTITEVLDDVCSPALSVAVITHSTISDG